MTLEEEVAEVLSKAEMAVAFTGAGISTESGVPDFRSPGGIWERFDPDLFTIQRLRSNPEETWDKLVEIGKEMLGIEVKPNPAHIALAELEDMGLLKAVITQNVDSLHQAAGNSPENVIELHGSLRELQCMGCDMRIDMIEIKEMPPTCERCGCIMKPAVVLFGESLPMDAFSRAQSLARKSDVFLVVGSSLVVYPAASIPQMATQTGSNLIIVNRDETHLDSKADIVIQGEAGEILPKIVENVK